MSFVNATPRLTLLPPPTLPNPCAVHPACDAQFRAQSQTRFNNFQACVTQSCVPYATCQQRLVSELYQDSYQAGRCATAFNPGYGSIAPPTHYY